MPPVVATSNHHRQLHIHARPCINKAGCVSFGDRGALSYRYILENTFCSQGFWLSKGSTPMSACIPVVLQKAHDGVDVCLFLVHAGCKLASSVQFLNDHAVRHAQQMVVRLLRNILNIE